MNQKIKSRKQQQKSRRVAFVLLAFFLAGLFFWTWCRVQSTRIGYEIADETRQQNRLLAFQNNLKIELARLKAPERIEKIARQKLGLVNPTSDQLVTLP